MIGPEKILVDICPGCHQVVVEGFEFQHATHATLGRAQRVEYVRADMCQKAEEK